MALKEQLVLVEKQVTLGHQVFLEKVALLVLMVSMVYQELQV